MENDHTNSPLTDSVELHRIAEERMRVKTPDTLLSGNVEATERRVHDLEVRQIELEIQNTELRDARYDAEIALEKYIDLYELAPVGYFNLNRDGTIIAVNLSAGALIRIERSLLPGRYFVDFLADDCRPTFTLFLERIFTTRSDDVCEAVLMDNVGVPLIVQIGAAISPSGRECRLSLINITEHSTTGQQQEFESGHHEDTTLESGNRVLELTACSIREALDASLALLTQKALDHSVVIQQDLAAEADQRIVADFEMLKQIVFSLLANAIRFSPEGGTVDVKVVRDGDVLIITIADKGTGIKEEYLPNLFETVTPLQSLSVQRNEGSGLCLPLIRHLLELHDGTIRVESELGAGSRFTIRIPIKNCQGVT